MRHRVPFGGGGGTCPNMWNDSLRTDIFFLLVAKKLLVAVFFSRQKVT